MVSRNSSTWQLFAVLQSVTDGRGQLLSIADTNGVVNPADNWWDADYGMGEWKSAGITSMAQTFQPKRWITDDEWGSVSQFRNRAYDPGSDRWLQEDPIGVAGGINLYNYNGNNPASFRDPFGLCPPKDEDYSTCEPGTSGWYAHRAATGQGNPALNEVGGVLTSCAESVACNVVLVAAGPVGAAAARIGNALKTAATAVGNVSVEVGSATEARIAGRIWTGIGGRSIAKRGTTEAIGRVSADGTRVYRSPAIKAGGEMVANLERKVLGKSVGNTRPEIPQLIERVPMIDYDTLLGFVDRVVRLTFAGGHIVRAKLILVEPDPPHEIIYDVLEVIARGPESMATTKPHMVVAADSSDLLDVQFVE